MNKKEQVIRVAVVDDHLIVREGVRLILETGQDIEMVGDATDGATAIHLVEETQPDVVLMDLRMPGMDGLQAIEHIRDKWPHIAVVILTTYNEDTLMLCGLRAGACGYLLKDTSRETLLDTIRTAARGETLLQPDIMSRILSHMPYTSSPGQTTSSSSTSASPGTPGLTEREREVLLGVAHGERSKEIAIRLGIAERTVKTYLSNIYTKLEVDSRASAVARAIERGLLP